MSNENKKRKPKSATQITMPHSVGEIAAVTGILLIAIVVGLAVAAQRGYWPMIKAAIGVE